MTDSPTPPRARRWPAWLFGAVFALVGLALTLGGLQLAGLGGSWYYLIAGLALIASGVLIALGKATGVWLQAVLFIVTVLWSIWEAGFDFWPMVPRLAPFVVMALVTALLAPSILGARAKTPARATAAVMVVLLLAGAWGLFQPHNAIRPTELAQVTDPDATLKKPGASQPGDWRDVGREGSGRRYAPYDDINLSNVGDLKVAWTYRTGDVATPPFQEENVPLQVGDTLFVCTPADRVIALDSATGAEKWTFDPQASGPKEFRLCRSLGYADLSQNTVAAKIAAKAGEPAPALPASDDPCATRIYLSTTDTRLIALDARTGELCRDFGDNGTVAMNIGMGDFDPRFYFSNSGPVVIENGLLILGGRVKDNQMVGEPSGVVRAFDTRDGALVWAWDLGRPGETGMPADGETFTQGTPNMWTLSSYDPELGLAYFPLGNATPDWWGGHRRDFDEEYSSSVVAVDYVTGLERWHFQTTHHDLWDYDVSSQPTLYDLDDGTPVLLQPTKRGEIFMLDRRTGDPVAEVEERAVPTEGGAPGETLSPTQPYSVGMPSIRQDVLTEADMWGMTIFDQMSCRIAFRKLRYEGDFTPQSTEGILQFPGNLGGFNWGSGAIDERTGYFIISDIRVPVEVKLIARPADEAKDTFGGLRDYPQYGTPFRTSARPFFSALGIPCVEPPFGTMTAIDLNTQQVVWQSPIGTPKDSAPFLGIKTRMPFPLGMPKVGGSLVTAGGLVFSSGATDHDLRAIDSTTGEVVWSITLPAGTQSTPMSYVSPETGKQYIVLTVGGAAGDIDHGDYVYAFALDD